MRTLVALTVTLTLTVGAAAAEPGEGRFESAGDIALQGLAEATFAAPTVVVATRAPDGLTFDFTAAYLAVDRAYADGVYVRGAGPLEEVRQDGSVQYDEVPVYDAVGTLTTIADRDLGVFIASGPGLVATVAAPIAAEIQAARAGSADPFGATVDAGADLGPGGWWRPTADVPLHLATSIEGAVITLTGDFDVYLYQAAWTVNGQTFETGVVETGPGQARVERDILHLRGATLTLRAPEARVLAEAVDAQLAGTLRLDEASGYYEEDGTRWEANGLPALLQGTFRVRAEVLDAATTSLALQGDLVHASLAAMPDAYGLAPATAGTAAAATTGALALVAGAVFVARRGRERWIAGHVDTASDCVERALRASADGRHAEALRWYRRARALAPKDALLALDEGHAADAVGDAAAARRAYEDALRLDPDLAEGHLRYARALAVQGLQPAALSHLGRALALEPALAAEVPADAAFAAWRDHPRFADLLRNYRR